MNLNGSFGDWLKQRRKALDLTQSDLADQVGCSTMTIRKIEADERRPSKQISERMADVLAISPQGRAGFVAFARRVANPKPSVLDDWMASTPSGNLPPQSTPFIGREHELAQIADRLTDPTCRLLTLVGPGGMGKTRLALQAASDRVGEFADGVYFVSLTPVGSTTLIASAIASALQLSFYGQEDPDVQIVNYLRGKHTLLVMDNYEHLLAGIGLLADLLANAPRLKILATSRERLNMQEEWVLPLEGLAFPPDETNNDADSYDAVQLFVQTARRLQPDFSLDGSQKAVIDICQAVEGMPLGIELAATWLRAMPCQLIAGQIRRDLNFLATPLRNIPERHRSLRAVFEHSWVLLSDVERSVLMKLSVFRGGIDPEAAEHVAGASLLLLAGLVDKSLIRLNPAGRYEMHELLRQFAADKLLESGQADETRQRHLQFFLELAEQLERRLFGSQLMTAWDRLEIELDNFRAALAFASQAEDFESGLRLAGALGWFWNRRTRWIEGRTWLETFLAAGANASIPARAKALHHVLELNWELGDQGYAVTLCTDALTLAHTVQDPWVKAWLLSSIGFVERFQTEPRWANLEEALVLFRQISDTWGICETLGRLAVASLAWGKFARASELLEEEIRLARQAGDKSVLSYALCLSASKDWYCQSKIEPRTEHKYQEALKLFRELGYKNGIVWALLGLGQIAQLRGEEGRAKALFEQSLRLGQDIGSKGFNMDSLIHMAKIFCVHGEAESAARIFGAVSAPFYSLYSGSSTVIEIDKLNFERSLDAARIELGETTFAAAFAEGQTMTLDQAVAYALDKAAYAENE